MFFLDKTLQSSIFLLVNVLLTVFKLEKVMIKKETGVMVMKDGKAWGVTYKDGHSTDYGWLNPADKAAVIHDPKFCTKTTDVTYKDSYLIPELQTGKLVKVERVTEVRILDI